MRVRRREKNEITYNDMVNGIMLPTCYRYYENQAIVTLSLE